MAITARQRACAHPVRQVAPTLDPRYERCQLCGLIRAATIAAPWIIAHDETAPEAPAPDIFPDRDPSAYIAESNASAPRRREKRRAKPSAAKGNARTPANAKTVAEPSAPYVIAFSDHRLWRWARELIDTTLAGEMELGGGRDLPDAWLRWPDDDREEELAVQYNAAG